jgi:hypothetical protein
MDMDSFTYRDMYSAIAIRTGYSTGYGYPVVAETKGEKGERSD